MKQKIITEIIKLIRKAQKLAFKIGIPNILQPGLVKEMIISEILNHDLIFSKRNGINKLINTEEIIAASKAKPIATPIIALSKRIFDTENNNAQITIDIINVMENCLKKYLMKLNF